MCSVCLAKEPNKSTDKPVEGPVEGPNAKTDETGLQPSESKQDSVNIPLDQIWALDMPGTRDVRDLEPDFSKQRLSNKELIRRSLVVQIQRAIQWPHEDKIAAHGFIAEGTDLEALTLASDVLLEKQKRVETFRTGIDLTAIFYSHRSGHYIYLDKVTQDGHVIRVHYHFIRRSAPNQTGHFALIPLRKLSTGNYHVKMIRGPTQQAEHIWESTRQVDAKLVEKVVCKSFQFKVVPNK